MVLNKSQVGREWVKDTSASLTLAQTLQWESRGSTAWTLHDLSTDCPVGVMRSHCLHVHHLTLAYTL